MLENGSDVAGTAHSEFDEAIHGVSAGKGHHHRKRANRGGGGPLTHAAHFTPAQVHAYAFPLSLASCSALLHAPRR